MVDPTKGDPGQGWRALPRQLRDVPQLLRGGRRAHPGQVRPLADGRGPQGHLHGDETGPQSMPVFNDTNLDSTAKRDIIAFLKSVEEAGNPGGLSLGRLGPVTEGMFAWIFGLGLLVGIAVWLGKKAA
jgi:ubiquinol-cytochrome c reductase cytochrome c subunit